MNNLYLFITDIYICVCVCVFNTFNFYSGRICFYSMCMVYSIQNHISSDAIIFILDDYLIQLHLITESFSFKLRMNASCMYHVCIMNASEMYHRCNILKERP